MNICVIFSNNINKMSVLVDLDKQKLILLNINDTEYYQKKRLTKQNIFDLSKT